VLCRVGGVGTGVLVFLKVGSWTLDSLLLCYGSVMYFVDMVMNFRVLLKGREGDFFSSLVSPCADRHCSMVLLLCMQDSI